MILANHIFYLVKMMASVYDKSISTRYL